MRARIVLSVAVLLFATLAASGGILWAVESARVDDAVRSAANQEIEEFRTLQSQGKDPNTAEPFTSAEDLLQVFLGRNVPGDSEMLVGWVEGRPRFVSAGEHRSLATDPAFEAAVARLLPTGDSDVIDTTHGPVRLTVQPIRETSGTSSALVVVGFVDDAKADLRELMRTYAAIAALSFLLVVAIAAWQAGRLLSPIRVLSDSTRRITETDLSARLPVSGNDDLTALTLTVNQMLDRLESAFEGQRQFLDDAGHELKTPLTVVRGHLELLDGADPDEVAQTRALLLDETDRMARLVGDLILLAKSRRPGFVQAAPVDVGDLTDALHAKARALGDRRWVVDEAAQVQTEVDEQRITQAVLALADNAVKHTSDGDEIGLGSAVGDGDLLLWVRDTGAGIPPEHREQVLERFGRSRTRPDDEGLGLGLSIVSAIAAAHGGTVEVGDSPIPGPRGPGTLVTIRIPLTEEDPWPTS